MNTDVTVAVPQLGARDEGAVARRIAAVFAADEATFSRFRTDSELSALNRAIGPTPVSRALFDVLARAQAYHADTGGLFDPAVGGALVALGYDRSFELGLPERQVAAPGARPPRFSDLSLDPATYRVQRPANMFIDLAGLVKGRAVDRAASLLPAPGFVDAGGDAAFKGTLDGSGWLIDVEDPHDARRKLITLRVHGGAVATSAPNRRRWGVAGGSAHHLVDPRSQRPADSDLAQVTVIAPTAELADVLAKTAFVLGLSEAAAFLSRRAEVGGLLVPRGGPPRLVGEVEVTDA
jgi:thiamine biosynthesis lipoprotein